MLAFVAGDHRMQGKGCIVVNPQDSLALHISV